MPHLEHAYYSQIHITIVSIVVRLKLKYNYVFIADNEKEEKYITRGLR